jgi:uncharacterized protein (DUF2147 family)
MLRSLALVSALLLSVVPAWSAPRLTGFWLTQDRNGVIEVSHCGDRLCARIVGVVLDHPDDKMPLDYQGTPQCGLPLITDATKIRPNLWKGHLTDPRTGSVYGAEIHLDPDGNLALRGYLGFTLLGRTQVWTRYPGSPPADCRLVAGAGSSEASR